MKAGRQKQHLLPGASSHWAGSRKKHLLCGRALPYPCFCPSYSSLLVDFRSNWGVNQDEAPWRLYWRCACTKRQGTSRNGLTIHEYAESSCWMDSSGRYSSRLGSLIQTLGSDSCRALTEGHGLNFWCFWSRTSEPGRHHHLNGCPSSLSLTGCQHLLAVSTEGSGRAEPLEHRQVSTNEKLEVLKALDDGVYSERSELDLIRI